MITLSNHELQVLNVIWQNGIVTSNQIMENLNLKQSSIRAILQRLLKKEAIVIYQKQGKKNLYQANLDKKIYIKQITNQYVQTCKLIQIQK